MKPFQHCGNKKKKKEAYRDLRAGDLLSIETILQTTNGALRFIIAATLCGAYHRRGLSGQAAFLQRAREIHHLQSQVWTIMERPPPDDPTKMLH